ncbi:unnamed protein product, partial [Rotaria sp. Silwood2]
MPSIIHLYIIRGIMGDRVQVFSADAIQYIQPYLSALNSNEPHPGIKFRATTSYEQVVERRGAELIIRLASNIQYQKDILSVISQIEKIDFFTYDQSFIHKAKLIVERMFGPSPDLSNDLRTAINNSKMIIKKESCEEAVHLFINVLMPQHFILMNYRVNIDNNETSTELQHQTAILKLPYRFFLKPHYLLNRLVRRGLLKKGKFLKSSKQTGTYESYFKYLPSDSAEENELICELQKHNIEYGEYRDIYNISALSPDGTMLTADGELMIQKQNVNSMQLNNQKEVYALQNASNPNIVQDKPIVNISIENKVVANPSVNSLSLSNDSTFQKAKLSIDPIEALKNPSTIPPRILSKCKQILLSKSPIITKTCWNRRFGGDGNLCLSAIELLTTVGILLEGHFTTTATKTYISWMKQLPSDPTNITDTLEFQQFKLNVFNVTWQEYASSFKCDTFGHSKTPSLVTTAAAGILRSKPYSDIGYILDESNVLKKDNKYKSTAQNTSHAMDKAANRSGSVASINPNGLNASSSAATNDDNMSINSNIPGHRSNTVDSDTRLTTASVLATSTPSQLSSSIELHDVSLNPEF